MNHGFAYVERLSAKAAGRSVLEHLARSYPHTSREAWAARIAEGRVELDGAVVPAEVVLRAGQALTWHRPPWEEPEVPRDFAVLYEDDVLLAVAKPSGLPCAPGGGFLENTLLHLVQQRDAAWMPMHRLGRGTSGLVLYARTRAARAALAQALRAHAMEKRYVALARGRLAPQVIRAPIGPVSHPRLGTLHAAQAGGLFAESHVEEGSARGDDTRAVVRIVTGRPHQIRIHLAYAGHPLVGDPLYGPGGLPRGEVPALPGDLGYNLHAWRLALAHPTTGRRISFEAPPPAALGEPSPFHAST